MLKDVLPFSETWESFNTEKSTKNKAVGSLVRYIEKKLGVKFLIQSPFTDPIYEEMADLHTLIQKFQNAGILKFIWPGQALPDEPNLHSWVASLLRQDDESGNASGAHQTNPRAALTATLAESVERYLWYETTDYFDVPTTATLPEIVKKGEYIDPKTFSGVEERHGPSSQQLDNTSVFKWIKGYSWTKKKTIWIPSQIITGNSKESRERIERKEPLIRGVTTNGLATRQTREGAVLYGALELIERDAFMIMWLNQLTLPRFDLEDLCSQNSSLAELVATCKQYRLKIDLIRMITDAPTYAICAVVTDETEHEPKVILGLRAHPNKFAAAEKAILEALRIRQMTRHMLKHPPKDWHDEKTADEIGHTDRLLYWASKERYKKLAFLTKGPVQCFEEPWEVDTEDEHLARILDWCKAVGYEFASVSLTKSKKNVSPWHIEMVVIPKLQPIHLNEKMRHLGGERLKVIPEMFGYSPIEPHITDPHPFA